MPAVYLVLGLPGSGRREIVRHLVEDGLPEESAITIYQAVGDAPAAGDAAAAPLFAHPGVALSPFTFAGGEFRPAAATEAEADAPDAVFVFADGRGSFVDQLEVFPAWLQARGWELTRILLVAHCDLAAAHPEVAAWHLAAAHFADVILLNRRGPGAGAWIQELRRTLAAGHFPCQVAFVKQGRVDNVPQVLFPEARRLTLIFDHLDPLEELELDEDNLPDDPLSLENKPDPYFERRPNGQRCKPVPDVTKYL